MGSNFFNNEFAENVNSLYDSVGNISTVETMEFENKWSGVVVSVPMNYINFAELVAKLEQEYPGLTGEYLEPMVLTEELTAALGEVAPALVDYVNTVRRKTLREAIHTYSKIGYLDSGLNEKGKLVYSIPQDVEIDDDVKTEIVAAVIANVRFS